MTATIPDRDGNQVATISINLERWRLVISVIVLAITLVGAVFGAMKTFGAVEIREAVPPLIRQEVAREIVEVRHQMREEQLVREEKMQKEIQAVLVKLTTIDARTEAMQRTVDRLFRIEFQTKKAEEK